MNIRSLCLTLLCLGLAWPAAAQPHKPAAPAHQAAAKSETSKDKDKDKAKPAGGGPKELSKSEDWTAATYQESGQTVCYAFTKVQSSTPAIPGRTEVILTVTERQTGRDAVAISAGFPYGANATVTVQVDQTGLDFYTHQRNAFARDGKGAVAAFQKGTRAIARSPGPKDTQVTDTFSLKGFSAAYEAIVKACPAK